MHNLLKNEQVCNIVYIYENKTEHLKITEFEYFMYLTHWRPSTIDIGIGP